MLRWLCILLFVVAAHANAYQVPGYVEGISSADTIIWKINTSNQIKLQDFQKLFAQYGYQLTSTHFDVREIDADPVSVVAHKASQFDDCTLVEDTSLDVEGASVGINVRWLMGHLNEYIGRKATWRVLLAYRLGDEVYVYKGEVNGTLVPSRGDEGFGFDFIFMPDCSDKTLAESKPNEVNARALAVDAFVQNNIFKTVPAIYDWDGPWQ